MPVDLAEDSIELMIELLAAGQPTESSYPFPSLSRSGRLDRRTFHTVVLENPYARATISPELGGRILRLEDKRQGNDCVPFNLTLPLSEGGLRGVYSNAGLQITTGFQHRLNSMGQVSYMPDFNEDEESPSALWWGEICGDGLSLNVRYSMPPDAACIEVEVRAFNRSLEPTPYNGGLAVMGAWIRTNEGWLLPSGLFIESDDLGYGEPNGLFRFNRQRYLAPRQLDTWRARIFPHPSLADLRRANSSVAVGWDRSVLQMNATTPFPGSKVVVLTDKGATMELPMDLHPEHVSEISLESMPDEIVELVILDAGRAELIRASRLGEAIPADRQPSDQAPKMLDSSDLKSGMFSVEHRALAHLLQGYEYLKAKEFENAAVAFEQSLLFNAEDHLAWWMKGMAERMAGSNGEERPEILNAHFLAPLEPSLRAESYLASPSRVQEKSPILNPLEEIPESFVEVACLLLEAGLFEETATWIDESLRHHPLPMLHYLLAYGYLATGQMEFQAAEQMQSAVSPDPQPPYPWRKIERQVLATLAERFPADGSLKRMLAMVELSTGNA